MKKIISLEINNSNFFVDNFKMQFSEGLNCIMGGRGAGKSTILHFIKSCIDPEAEEERTTYNVLQNNLDEGLLVLTLQDEEGKKYRIEKSIEELPQAYSGKGKDFVDINSIFDDVQCDIYEAQSIEEIGRNSYDRLGLIDKMILLEKNEIDSEIESLQIALSDSCQQIKSSNAKINQLSISIKAFEGADEELARLKKDSPDDLNKQDEKQFESADKNEKTRLAEKRYIKGCQKRTDEVETLLIELVESVDNLSTFCSNNEHLGNRELIDRAYSDFSSLATSLKKMSKDALSKLADTLKNVEKTSVLLDEKHGKQQNEFTQLKQKFDRHKAFYNKWQALTKKIDEHEAVKKEIDLNKVKLDKYKRARKKLIDRFNTQKINLFNLRKDKIDALNEQFNGSIKITLTFGGILDEYEQLLRNALRGSNMRYNILIPSIVQNFTPDRFGEIVHAKDYNSLKTIAGIDKERAESIFNALYETDNIYQIECLYCSDLPDFLLKIDAKNEVHNKVRENYKKSEELSTGQRCTTVLPVIFAVSQNPLIIDQPEDNLDNKYISDSIHNIIKEQKEYRQLIFITHNPNIPVLSDAESNFFLNYSDKKSKIEKTGNVNEVKGEILNLLEGGKEAFEKREKLYNVK